MAPESVLKQLPFLLNQMALEAVCGGDFAAAASLIAVAIICLSFPSAGDDGRP